VAYVLKMLENGTGADRQLTVFEKTKNLTDVARYINSQYLTGI
jgi:carboxylate-amine ligase